MDKYVGLVIIFVGKRHERIICICTFVSSMTCSTRDQDQATNAEDVLFDMFKNEETGLLSVGKFLAVRTIDVIILAIVIY